MRLTLHLHLHTPEVWMAPEKWGILGSSSLILTLPRPLDFYLLFLNPNESQPLCHPKIQELAPRRALPSPNPGAGTRESPAIPKSLPTCTVTHPDTPEAWLCCLQLLRFPLAHRKPTGTQQLKAWEVNPDLTMGH